MSFASTAPNRLTTIAILLTAIFLSACGNAATPSASETTVVTDRSAPTPTAQIEVEDRAPELKAKRGLERRFLAAMEDGFDTQMLLFSRISPEAAAQIKPIKMTNGDRQKLSCFYDRAKKAGLDDHIEYSVTNNEKLTQAVKSNPNLSMATIEDNPVIYGYLTAGMSYGTEAEQDQMQQIVKDCGVMAMMTAKMEESGAMQAMMNAAMADDE